MDKKYILSKIKKYLFFVSIVLLAVSSSHLIYNYIYDDSKEIAEKWWTVSEAIIWEFPKLNPLKEYHNYNDYINHILYRSLLTYDGKKENISWDLWNCDYSNLAKVECFLNENILWSNWEEISIKDISSTYKIIKETNVNPIIKSILENVEIIEKEKSIIFKSTKKDINVLNILFQPILPESVVNSLSTKSIDGNFSPIDWIYSGKYVISQINQDDTVWITKIFLEKNKKYKNNPAYIDKIIFKLFRDQAHFLKHKNSINIFNDKNNLIWNSVPKLNTYKYYLPQYISLFVNSEKLEYLNIRKYVLENIDTKKLVSKLWKENFKEIKSPFINQLELKIENNNINIKSVLNSLGYYKKSTLWIKLIWKKAIENKEKDIIKKSEKTYSSEVSILKEELNKKEDNTEKVSEKTELLLKDIFKKSKYIYSPNWIDNYNFIKKDDILLKGKSENWVNAIFINDYKLKNFKTWDKDFFYRLSKSYENIKEGKNEYNIYFEKKWKKELKEKFTIFYSNDSAKLEKLKEELLAEKNKWLKEKNEKKQKEITSKNKENTEIKEKLEAEKIKKEIIKNKSNPNLTPEQIRKNKEIEELSKKIENLDDNLYYNESFEAYSLNLYFTKTDFHIEKSVEFIKNELYESWIKVNVVWISLLDLKSLLQDEKKNYDLLVTWINLWYFDFNIFPYFHSSQVKSGYNFSKFKKIALDQHLEELKSEKLPKSKIIELEKNIIEILKKEAITKTLYTPLYSNLVDKTVQGYELTNYLPSTKYRFEPLVTSYVLKKNIVNYDNKSISDYFKYLIKILF